MQLEAWVIGTRLECCVLNATGGVVGQNQVTLGIEGPG